MTSNPGPSNAYHVLARQVGCSCRFTSWLNGGFRGVKGLGRSSNGATSRGYGNDGDATGCKQAGINRWASR